MGEEKEGKQVSEGERFGQRTKQWPEPTGKRGGQEERPNTPEPIKQDTPPEPPPKD